MQNAARKSNGHLLMGKILESSDSVKIVPNPPLTSLVKSLKTMAMSKFLRLNPTLSRLTTSMSQMDTTQKGISVNSTRQLTVGMMNTADLIGVGREREGRGSWPSA